MFESDGDAASFDDVLPPVPPVPDAVWNSAVEDCFTRAPLDDLVPEPEPTVDSAFDDAVDAEFGGPHENGFHDTGLELDDDAGVGEAGLEDDSDIG